MHYISDLPRLVGKEITLKGWVSNKRSGKGIHFIILRDGSGFVQCVATETDLQESSWNAAEEAALESSVSLTGNVIRDERQTGGVEIQVTGLTLLDKGHEYPISKKEHGVDFLMDNRHLWLRSKRQWAIMGVRNHIIFSIHRFFQERGFIQMDAPIFTGNACEGTSTLFETDFYGDPAYLSQSGQLYGEAMAMAMGRIYTFGPTFRAEKSKTRRHLSEFWMIEPEMAFFDLDMDMDLIEDFLRFVTLSVLEHCRPELEILERNTEMLEKVAQPFPRIPYTEAIAILKGEKEVNGKNSIQTLKEDLEQILAEISASESEIEEKELALAKGGIKKGEANYFRAKVDKLKVRVKELKEKSENIPLWLKSAQDFEFGNDLGGSDETVITRLFEVPVMVYNWPKEVKAFYMKTCTDDPRFVRGVDVLAPEGFGEIVGGGERETNLDYLIEQIHHHQLPMEAFEWYLDLRRFGNVPHSGFGLGLERLVAWICGLHHVRETIPFPRMYGRLFP